MHKVYPGRRSPLPLDANDYPATVSEGCYWLTLLRATSVCAAQIALVVVSKWVAYWDRNNDG